jgi:type II secretory pathway component GspD/PulD (secretin)
LVAELDTRPATVAIHICIAELRPARDGEIDGGSSDAAATAPSIENDAAAWLAWAQQQGRLDVLSRPRLMTIDHQPASVRIGQIVPTGIANPDTDDPAEGDGSQRMEVGLSLGVTPRIAPEGAIIMELDVEHSRIVNPADTAAPRIGRMAVRTTVSANDGQTVIVSGLMQRTEDGDRQTIIAVTPQVNPERR